MDISDVAAFVKVVQAGSFTQAARSLEAPKSTVSAKVASLEKRLGVTLLQRTTRKLSMTEDGEAFFRACSQALAEIEAAETSLAQSQATPQGRLTVTAPVNLGKFLAQFLAVFLAKYPGIKIDLLLTNRYVDLVGEGVDVAIRGGALKSSSMIAKRIASNESLLVASPKFASQLQDLKHPRDIVNYDCLRFTSRTEWQFFRGGKSITVAIQSRISVDEFPALQALAEEGLGLAMVPNMLVREALEEGRLVRILPEWSGEMNAISIVYPAQRFQHPKVRAFVQECGEALKNRLRSSGLGIVQRAVQYFQICQSIVQTVFTRKVKSDRTQTRSKSVKNISLNQIFHEARTHNAWLDKPVSDEVLKTIYETMQWGPTSANSLPARVVFVKPGQWKDQLIETLLPGNVDKTRAAPVTAILAYDAAFYEQLPKLFPHADAKSWFTGNETLAKETAQYNAALQHGYFIVAARAHGLDVGPMAGFNKAAVDSTFFAGTNWKSSLLVNLGYGDADKLFPRNPRLSFDEGAQIRA